MNRSIGLFLLNIAVALYLLATGIIGLTGNRVIQQGEIRRAVNALNIGNLTETLIVVLSVLAIIAGAFVLLKFFNVQVPMTELLLLILALVWVIFIVMVNIIYPLRGRSFDFVPWLWSFSSNLMVLGGICLATERFGGR